MHRPRPDPFNYQAKIRPGPAHGPARASLAHPISFPNSSNKRLMMGFHGKIHFHAGVIKQIPISRLPAPTRENDFPYYQIKISSKLSSFNAEKRRIKP